MRSLVKLATNTAKQKNKVAKTTPFNISEPKPQNKFSSFKGSRNTSISNVSVNSSHIENHNQVVQRKIGFKSKMIDDNPHAIHQHAIAGVQGHGTKLPYYEKIQRAFPQHDLSTIQTFTGSSAKIACNNINAKAYATKNSIAFDNAHPDLHTVAHEAVHLLQQREGVQLNNGVSQVGDAYEQQADSIANKIVNNQSIADPQFATSSSNPSSSSNAVQLTISYPIKKTDGDLENEQELLEQLEKTPSLASYSRAQLEAGIEALEKSSHTFSRWRDIPSTINNFLRQQLSNEVSTYQSDLSWQPLSLENQQIKSSLQEFAFTSRTRLIANLINAAARHTKLFITESSNGEHAEEDLIQQVNDYIDAQQFDPQDVELELTINNSPCAEKRSQGDEFNGCSDELAHWQSEKNFKAIRIRFSNPYGGTDEFEKAKTRLEEVSDISMAPFSPKREFGDSSVRAYGKKYSDSRIKRQQIIKKFYEKPKADPKKKSTRTKRKVKEALPWGGTDGTSAEPYQTWGKNHPLHRRFRKDEDDGTK